ncbi:VWA domain-containing protein, partial [Pseudoalteromonas sp. PS5]|uniref:vWA domain-containing protein n=1 Tax=Pseudoalteromonas sp. PS5 TaxID=1437473 RepID=UPI000FFECCAF
MEFEFIRPQLLWLFVPWAIYCLMQWSKKGKQHNNQLIAPHLMKVVMGEQGQQSQKHNNSLLGVIFSLLTIIAVAGPSIEKQEVPVFKTQAPRVLVLDMSYSMYATDLTPNRLTQARFKTLDMLKLFQEGETGLVAYAGDAFTVSPLTTDVATLENLIPSLRPEIMPSKGSNVYAGIEEAINLLSGASATFGDIILITDGLEQEDAEDIQALLADSPYSLNIYALGTTQGAPIKLPDGGFLKDQYGQIVVPKLFTTRLEKLAKVKGGKFATYTTDNRDINTFKPSLASNTAIVKTEQESAKWRVDAGVYLLILLVPLALLLVRNHAIMLSALLVFTLLPQQKAVASEWLQWFKNNDQNALQAYQNEAFERAASANDPVLKGAALYKAGDYEGAASVLNQTDSAQGQYNLGNALAQLGKLDESIAAYDKALAMNPDFTQAKDNKAVVEALKNQQDQQGQQNQQGQQDQQ